MIETISNLVTIHVQHDVCVWFGLKSPASKGSTWTPWLALVDVCMRVCSNATWTTFLKRLRNIKKDICISYCTSTLYIDAKYIAPSAHIETCINSSQFRCLFTFILCPTYIPEQSKPLCVYGRGAGRPANPLSNSHTLSISHATYHALCYHPHLTSRTFQPSPFRSKTKTRRKKKRDLVSLTTCPAIYW